MTIKKTAPAPAPATGRAKPQNLVMSETAPPEDKIDMDQDTGAIIAQLCAQSHEMQRRLTHLEAQQGQVALYMPRNEIPLGSRDVSTLLDEEPGAWFECLEDYKRGGFKMNRGKVFCGQNYDNIAGHVSAGLKVMGAEAPRH